MTDNLKTAKQTAHTPTLRNSFEMLIKASNDMEDKNKTNYKALFGAYVIKVIANSKEEAIQAVLSKFNSYKDGGDKKEYIRAKIANAFNVWTDRELL